MQHQPGQSTPLGVAATLAALLRDIAIVAFIALAVLKLGPCPPPSKPVPASAPVDDDMDLLGDGGQTPPAVP